MISQIGRPQLGREPIHSGPAQPSPSPSRWLKSACVQAQVLEGQLRVSVRFRAGFLAPVFPSCNRRPSRFDALGLMITIRCRTSGRGTSILPSSWTTNVFDGSTSGKIPLRSRRPSSSLVALQLLWRGQAHSARRQFAVLRCRAGRTKLVKGIGVAGLTARLATVARGRAARGRTTIETERRGSRHCGEN